MAATQNGPSFVDSVGLEEKRLAASVVSSMSELALYDNLMLLGSGIEACIQKRLIQPALILIYSGIDTAGWLGSDKPNASRTTFIDWVERYLLKAKPLACTAVDLYAARCGLLHTFTPDSKLSSEGEARRICYAWGTATAEDLQRATASMNATDRYVAVHVEGLYEGWRLGLRLFTEEIGKGAVRKSRVYAKADRFFSPLCINVVKDALGILDKDAARDPGTEA